MALAPWAVALFREPKRSRGFLSGFLLGLAFWGLTVPWVSFVVTRFGGQPPWMGGVCVFLLSAILAEWPAVVGWAVVAAFPPESRWRLAAFPALWMASEHARSYAYKGFPWNLTANALYRHPFWLQTASVWGAFGIGGLIAALWAAVAALWVLKTGVRRMAVVAAISLSLSALLLMTVGRREAPPAATDLRIACLQPDIPQSAREGAARAAENYRSVIAMAGEAADRHPDLILVPESSFPLTWQRSAVLRQDLSEVARRCGCAILFNDIDEVDEEVYYNAARLLTPDGLAPRTYRKVHLVPFGEYVPLPRVFFFMRSVTRAVGAFTPARAPVVLEAGKLRIGPAVCYEMTYPSLPRREVRDGANLLATLSNDAWYGRAGAQAQHFSAMVLRAIENGRPFARAAITGISGVVDARGRLRGELPEDRRGIVFAAVAPGRGETIWSRWGGVLFPAAADAGAAVVLMLGVMRWSRHS